MRFETLAESEWAVIDAVWEMLEAGDLDRARSSLEPLRKARGDHPDVRISEAALRIEEGDARGALDVLAGAERSADPALYFHLRALAAFEAVMLERARDDAQRAVAIQPPFAEAHDLLSRVLEHLGDADGAEDHGDIAHRLDPDKFPGPLEIDDEEFDRIVRSSVDALPAAVRAQIDHLPVLIEDLPTLELLCGSDPPLPPDILGLFAGRHLLERSHADPGDAPGTIHIFRRNLLRACADREELEREVRVTVQHEVGHLLGLDEDDLERWGLA